MLRQIVFAPDHYHRMLHSIVCLEVAPEAGRPEAINCRSAEGKVHPSAVMAAMGLRPCSCFFAPPIGWKARFYKSSCFGKKTSACGLI